MGERVLVPGPCGTRAGYVSGCRCRACRDANRDRYRNRQARIREMAAEVQPNGPGLPGTMVRGGREVRILRCPGTGGHPCVVKGASWLKGRAVCLACVERATVWDGQVPVARAREHLLELRERGVGYKSVAAACDVSHTTLGRVLANVGTIRASTERRILAVDEGARADSALVPADRTNSIIAEMRARGFTLRHLGRLFGYQSPSHLQVGALARVHASTEALAEKLWRRVERGELAPERVLADARAERAWLLELLDRGVPALWLSERLGFHVQRSDVAKGERMFPKNRDAVRALRAELEELRREGGERPEGWEAAGTSGITRAFGFEGGWSWGSGGIVGGGRAPKKPKPKKARRPPPMTAEQRREREREKMRARRAAMDPAALRERNRLDQRAKRERDRARKAAA